MKIQEGLVKLKKPTKEINIYIERDIYYGRKKAKILEAKQDSSGRIYITVY